jgi:hypothetical protein
MGNWPIIVIELVLFFGGCFAFYLWQMRDLKREKEKREAAERAASAPESRHPEGE